MPPRKRKLPKRQVFIAEYLKDFNGTRAAQRAGYSQDPDASRAVAARLLAQPHVAADITASMRAVLDRAEFSLERWLTEVWKMALADNTEVFDRDGKVKPFDEWPIESRRGLQGMDAEEIYGQVDGERQQVGVMRKPRFVPKPPWFEMLGKFYKVLDRNAERAGENGGSTVTILQLLQQAILPEGTTRQRIGAEAIDVVAAPVENARPATIEPSRAPADAKSTGADMAQGSKATGGAGSGGTAATGVDDALVGLAGGVFGNGNGNGMPD